MAHIVYLSMGIVCKGLLTKLRKLDNIIKQTCNVLKN